MTNSLITSQGTQELRVLVFAEDLTNDYRNLPQRGYDFTKGDRRFYDQQRAIDHANDVAVKTGVRQVVRLDGAPLLGGQPVWLVQAVGS